MRTLPSIAMAATAMLLLSACSSTLMITNQGCADYISSSSVTFTSISEMPKGIPELGITPNCGVKGPYIDGGIDYVFTWCSLDDPESVESVLEKRIPTGFYNYYSEPDAGSIQCDKTDGKQSVVLIWTDFSPRPSNG